MVNEKKTDIYIGEKVREGKKFSQFKLVYGTVNA